MNQQPDNYWQVPQRQAKAGLLIIIFKAVVTILKALWPVLVVLFIQKGKKGGGWMEAIIIGVPILILMRSLIGFYWFRFFIENKELIIRKGLISKKTIAIPLSKIQAVHIEQGLLHQLARVAKVRIDTAGSGKTEAVIDSLSVEKAEDLKMFLLHEKHTESELQNDPAEILPEEEGTVEGSIPVKPRAAWFAAETPIIRLSVTDILKLGLSANHIQTFFIVLGFSFSMFSNLEEVFGDKILRTVRDSSSKISHSLSAISLLIALVLTLSVVVSLGRIALRYFDFRLSETLHGFRLSAGLINTRQNLIPFSKIQFISWKANWIRRKIRLYTLDFHQVAGSEEDMGGRKQKIKIPVTRATDIGNLLTHYHQPVTETAHSIHRVDKAYVWRRTLLIGILPVALLVVADLFIWWKPWMLIILIWIPYVFFNALVFRNNFRLYVAPDALQINSGVWGRQSKVLLWYKIQQVTLQQSIYQRNHELATVELITAGGTLTIPYIPLELASTIRNYALYEVERSNRSWL